MPTLPVLSVFYNTLQGGVIRMKYADHTLSPPYKLKDIATLAGEIDLATWIAIKEALRVQECWIEVK